MLWFLQSPFFHSGKQRSGLDAEKLGCAIRSFDLPVGCFQNQQQVLTFPALKFRLGEEFWLGWGASGRRECGWGSHVRSKSRAPPRARITARSITLRNSRTLPGQS